MRYVKDNDKEERTVQVTFEMTIDELKTLRNGIMNNFMWSEATVGSNDFWNEVYEVLDDAVTGNQ